MWRFATKSIAVLLTIAMMMDPVLAFGLENDSPPLGVEAQAVDLADESADLVETEVPTEAVETEAPTEAVESEAPTEAAESEAPTEAQESDASESVDSVKAAPPKQKKIEWMPLPLLGGDSDMGILVGAQLLLATFKDGYYPYRFRTHTQVALSFKPNHRGGVDIPVHMDFIKLDFPGLASGKLRLLIGLHYDQVNNSGYFGIGNAARAVAIDPTAEGALDYRIFQYVRQEPKLRMFIRYKLAERLELALGLRFMWMNVKAKPGSKLEHDLPTLRGTDPHFGLHTAAGLIYDKRDHEYNPTKGVYFETALRFQPGLGNDLHFGAYSVDGRVFVPIIGEYLVFGSRFLLDMLFGNVPFYEMARSGAFEPVDFIGGRMGLSGIPERRYHGKVKAGVNLELRSVFWTFWLLKQRFKVGAAAFVNVGRVWADYTGNSVLDGSGHGLKLATGGGLRIQLNETMIIRIDLAWAKEVSDAGAPVGIYLDAYHPF